MKLLSRHHEHSSRHARFQRFADFTAARRRDRNFIRHTRPCRALRDDALLLQRHFGDEGMAGEMAMMMPHSFDDYRLAYGRFSTLAANHAAGRLCHAIVTIHR